jgi:ABC-type phosphate/phosphonate transport system substrate-binding protein
VTIASLPMYDLPEVRDDTDRFWAALSKLLDWDVPLSRGGDYHAPWLSSQLIFSQTCGYPLSHALSGKVDYVATPIYDAYGCEGSTYCSLIFAREALAPSAFLGKIAAVNTQDSMSGMLALRLFFAPVAKTQRFFARTLWSGSHAASLLALQSGEANVAAIDCVTVALLKRHRPQVLSGLVEIGRSPSAPALPFITKAVAADKVQTALRAVFSDAAMAETLRALLLKDFRVLPATAYDVIPEFERQLKELGDPVLL